MKKCYTLIVSFLKRFFLFLKLHIHVEAGIRGLKEEEKPMDEMRHPGKDSHDTSSS